MTRDEMLAVFRDAGQDAGSDYNDDDRVNGWFGWDFDPVNLTLTIRHEDTGDNPPKSVTFMLIEGWDL